MSDNDQAAVEALLRVRCPPPSKAYSRGVLAVQYVEGAEAVLAAIRKGEVPGVNFCQNDAEMGRFHVAYCEQLKQERDALRAELEQHKNGATCRAEERDSARSERDNFKRRLIEAEDGRARMHAEVQRLRKEVSEAKGFLQGDCASERGNQSLINAAREMMAVLERHRDGEDEARERLEQATALLRVALVAALEGKP